MPSFVCLELGGVRSLTFFRRQRDGHLNCSTESLTAVTRHAAHIFYEREHILYSFEGVGWLKRTNFYVL